MCDFQGYFSRTLSFNFPDFPGPGIFKKTNPGLSKTFQEAGELCGDQTKPTQYKSAD